MWVFEFFKNIVSMIFGFWKNVIMIFEIINLKNWYIDDILNIFKFLMGEDITGCSFKIHSAISANQIYFPFFVKYKNA